MAQNSKIIDFSKMSNDEIATNFSKEDLHNQINLRGAYANKKPKPYPFGKGKIKNDGNEKALFKEFDMEVIEPGNSKGGKKKKSKRSKRTRKMRKHKASKRKHLRRRTHRRKTRR